MCFWVNIGRTGLQPRLLVLVREELPQLRLVLLVLPIFTAPILHGTCHELLQRTMQFRDGRHVSLLTEVEKICSSRR